jgi:hypothetical protein
MLFLSTVLGKAIVTYILASKEEGSQSIAWIDDPTDFIYELIISFMNFFWLMM